MDPENDTGNIEYKLKLLDKDIDKIERLSTQMRYRCFEGDGECIYNLGVGDDGTMHGITEDEYNETIKHINIMADKNNYSVNLLTSTPVKDDKNIYEVLVREINDNKYIDIKVAVAGNANSGKCLSRNTPVLMYNGKIKMIQDIKIGDILMGDNSTPRKVLETITGSDILYEIIMFNGDTYKVTKNHILCFKILDSNPTQALSKIKVDKLKGFDIVELSFEQYINLAPDIRRTLKFYKTKVEFPEKHLPLDPYIIGYWLGSMSTLDIQIPTVDKEVINYFNTIYKINRLQSGKIIKNDFHYVISNIFLKSKNLNNSKYIPDIYKYNSRENRLKLLAGFLDSSGLYNKNQGYFELTQSISRECIIDDIIYLCKSLGFSCCKSTLLYKDNEQEGNMYTIRIAGDGIEKIPIFCLRNQVVQNKSQKNCLLMDIYDIIISNTKESYYGFELDGNGRFILGDFTVTHNSSTIGSLISGKNDNGCGLTRSYVFNYLHELKTGRTSSIAHQIIGFDREGKIVNTQGVNKFSWPEIVIKSSKIISFFDLAGQEKYLKTTIMGLTSIFPDICIIMVDANNGIKPMTKEHIFLCVTLKIPFIIVITKVDICKDRQNILKETLLGINKFLKYPGIRRIPVNVKANDDIILSARNIYSESITPVFQLSAVTGEGMEELKLFLNILGKKQVKTEDDKVEFFIDNIFNVYGFGLVLGGHLLNGVISVGDKLLIGPYTGSYEPIVIRSIHSKKTPMQTVTSGTYVCLGIKKTEKTNIKRGNVIISNKGDKLIIKKFVAEITVLRTHSTTVKIGYEPMFHAYSIRQVTRIVDIISKQNARGNTVINNDVILRNGDTARIVLEFRYHPEYLKVGTRFILAEGKCKIVGEVLSN